MAGELGIASFWVCPQEHSPGFGPLLKDVSVTSNTRSFSAIPAPRRWPSAPSAAAGGGTATVNPPLLAPGSNGVVRVTVSLSGRKGVVDKAFYTPSLHALRIATCPPLSPGVTEGRVQIHTDNPGHRLLTLSAVATVASDLVVVPREILLLRTRLCRLPAGQQRRHAPSGRTVRGLLPVAALGRGGALQRCPPDRDPNAAWHPHGVGPGPGGKRAA